MLQDSIHKFRTYRKQSAVYDTIRKTFEERVNARPADGKKLSPQEERLQKARIQEMVEMGRYLQARRIHMVSRTITSYKRFQSGGSADIAVIDAGRAIQRWRRYDTRRKSKIVSETSRTEVSWLILVMYYRGLY